MKNLEIIIIHPTADGNHYKSHSCQGICTDYGGNAFSIQLLQTKKWFDERRFRLSPGDQLSAPETNRSFTVSNVTYADKRPKYAIITATLNNKASVIEESKISGGLAS